MISKKKVMDYVHNGYPPASKWDDEARYAYQLEEVQAGLDGVYEDDKDVRI